MKRTLHYLSFCLLLAAVGLFAAGCKREGAQKHTEPTRDGGTYQKQIDRTPAETGKDSGTGGGTTAQPGTSGSDTGAGMGGATGHESGTTGTTTQPSGQSHTGGGTSGTGRNY